MIHDDVIKWKHFPRYWPFVRGIHRSPVNSPHKGQGRGALMFSLICVWINGCVNNREAGDLRRYRAHNDVTVMACSILEWWAMSYMSSLHMRFVDSEYGMYPSSVYLRGNLSFHEIKRQRHQEMVISSDALLTDGWSNGKESQHIAKHGNSVERKTVGTTEYIVNYYFKSISYHYHLLAVIGQKVSCWHFAAKGICWLQ